MPRRIASYSAASGWGPLNLVSTLGAYVIGVGMIVGGVNLFLSLRRPRTAPADPWQGNTLEWATSSPPPPHNFDELPPITSERPVRDRRLAAAQPQEVTS
jgi:heme/copper-type cytochrome/quinol oxidase subunit 1